MTPIPAAAAFVCFAALTPMESAPVIQCGVPAPTRDKPQSKLWHAHGHWWAWLPASEGSAVWKRTNQGWVKSPDSRNVLAGAPAWADVELFDDRVFAVLVERTTKKRLGRLRFAELEFDVPSGNFLPTTSATIVKNASGIETATVAVDRKLRRIWVAYTDSTKVFVTHTRLDDRSAWSDPTAIAEGLDPDDICAVVHDGHDPLVVWSNQREDRVESAAVRLDAAGIVQSKRTTIASGGKMADDHLHVKVAASGTVFVASKNSVDRVGQPQLVMYWRERGVWRARPYLDLEKKSTPSRPILALDPSGKTLLCIHSLYVKGGEGRKDRIEWFATDAARPSLDVPPTTLIRSGVSVNNATGTKQRMPADLPWIILASDSTGGVYEGVLPSTGSGRR